MPQGIMNGGGIGYTPGLPVNNIESFLPSLIPDLALWIKANQRYLREETIQSYADKQSYFVREALLKQFQANLTSSVITEIISDTPATPNSLIPLNLESDVPTIFPTLRSVPNELDAINISNYKDPISGKSHRLQLITSRPISAEGSVSSYSISYGFTISQNTITNQIILTPNYIENPIPNVNADVLGEPSLHVNNEIFGVDVEPTAEISEVIIYSRPLTIDENAKLEGYLAYKQNTQYALPSGHPYIPNMLGDPIFKYISAEITTTINSLNQRLADLNVALTDYVRENGETGLALNAPKYKEHIQDAVKQLADLSGPLSKGYLYARKVNNLTLETIFKAIQERKFSTYIINDATITEIITGCVKLNSDIISFTASLRESYTNPFKLQGGGGTPSVSQITDHVLFTDQAAKSKQLYQDLRAKAAQKITDGDSVYNSLNNILKDDITKYIDTITHQWNDIQKKNTELSSLLTPIQTSIESGAWLKYFPNIDTSFINNGTGVSIKYNDSALDLIQTYYTHTTNQIKQGDYAYILQEFKELNDLFNSFSSQTLNPIFRATYMRYLLKHVSHGNSLYTEFTKIYTDLNQYLININSFFTTGRETGQTITFPERVHTESHYKPLIADIYLRRVISLDESLFGLEYVEVGADGYLPGTSVIPFYSKFVNYNFENSKYTKTTPFLTDDGTSLKQTYQILEPLTQSIYNGLTNDDRTPLFTHTISSLIEIPRNKMDGIHCIDTLGSVEPVLLPIGLSINTWCLIYNIGENPIAVRHPDDMTDMIGSNNGILYMYAGGDNLYGQRPWTKQQLPYDTLLNTPRTSLSMYIDEIGTSIYVRETPTGYEPVYTPDGYLVEVIKADDGSVYDIDDLYKSNPYYISSVDLNKRSSLVFNSKKKKMVKIAPISFHMIQDIHTGFAIILNVNNLAGINEFGFAKAVRTPIQQIGTTYKIQGAYGDINLEAMSKLFISPYDPEPFLKFESIYRTRFAAPTKGTNVFVTNSFNPIVTPSGFIIEVPPIGGSTPLSYNDDDTQREIIIVNPIQIHLESVLYKYITPPPINYIRVRQEHLRFKSAKAYVQSEIDALNNIKSDISAFNSDAKQLCDDIEVQYKDSLTLLEENNSIFDSNIIPPKDALDNTRASIKSAMDNFFKNKDAADQSIQLYKSGIEDIDKLKKKVKYWENEGSAEIDSKIIQIHSGIQATLKKFGTTSSSDLNNLLQGSIKAQSDFHATLQKCMNYVLSPPAYISEVHSWYISIQPSMDKLKELYDDIVEKLQVNLPTILKAYDRQQTYAAVSQNIQKVFGDIQMKWSKIQDQKTLLDTYIQSKAGKLSPEQISLTQKKITDIDTKIAEGDIQMNALFKQVKTQPPTEQLLTSVENFQPKLIKLQESIQDILNGISV